MMKQYLAAVTDFTFSNLDQEKRVLEPLGFRIITGQCKTATDVIELCQNADAILTQFAPITSDVIRHLRNCRIIVRYGIGVDTVDIDAASEAGILVVNIPDYGIQEVADHTMSLLLAAVRKIPAVVAQVRRGQWENAPFRPIMGLSGKTLGLAGLGNIARAVAQRAQAFNLNVIAYDRYAPKEVFTEWNVRRVEWEQLLATSDILSIHLPLTEQTRHLLNREAFSKMKESAVLVNTSRGGVVDAEALEVALKTNQIAGAALDVLEEEPISPEHPLLQLSQCLITSHCAWYSEDSIIRLQQFAAMEICRLFSGERPKHIVNSSAVQESYMSREDNR
ncbi:C-terminal binding protein [Paenibacillus eucommiae]|uniref:D-3-phosphoglycerate dehydrogenase n=1 Tax=Paenibacillus eucommiae TaxID=1355755 RepID=A0ABS4JC16_9BACL|nr:C-terminal binding protein [Paenibacillus eucommiae]MBP1996284.1 D-3-phosphoglycerate dehydrogenase [Paenibacillus eucommiae]